MSEEIKETLDYISDRVIPNEKWNAVKNYIKDLQQKVEQLEKELEQKEAILGGIQQLEYKCEQLENIRKEAIEYIKEDMYVEPKELYGLVDGKHLLNILNKGSEDNE